MKRPVIAALLLLAVLIMGTAGYMTIEGWNLLDSLYMTVITVATVGFREVAELSPIGQVFTIAMVFAGVGGIAYSVGVLAEFMIEGQLTDLVEGRRMAKRIGTLSGHYIVAGMGRVGSVVCASFDEQGVPFVVIDRCDDCEAEATEHGWLYISGDATSEETLEAAGLTRAKGLVTALDTDADNLFVAMTARGMNPDLFIVARSSSITSESKILRAGADRVITPNVIGGRRMASSVLDPFVSDYLELVSHSEGVEYRLDTFQVGEGSSLAGRSIRAARVRDVTGAYIMAVARGGVTDSNPSADRVLAPGDHLVAFGTRAQLDALGALL
ncbi:MAG: NAD-binding protein [Coriobacteriia bacterium]|nr:NAD-binding protein [Coriobacteriia bacterium]MBN2840133.1 NAD-binding protein [Coriobacteriia bacterium]